MARRPRRSDQENCMKTAALAAAPDAPVEVPQLEYPYRVVSYDEGPRSWVASFRGTKEAVVHSIAVEARVLNAIERPHRTFTGLRPSDWGGGFIICNTPTVEVGSIGLDRV